MACAMDSPFGGIGWTRMARRPGRAEVDTLTFGAFPPEVFARVGLFDERSMRNQDDELNVRIRRAGGHVVLDPSVQVFYRPRGELRAVWRQYRDYGRWKVPVMRKHRCVLTPRSLAPVAFLGVTAALASAAPASGAARSAPRRRARAVRHRGAGVRRRRHPSPRRAGRARADASSRRSRRSISPTAWAWPSSGRGQPGASGPPGGRPRAHVPRRPRGDPEASGFRGPGPARYKVAAGRFGDAPRRDREPVRGAARAGDRAGRGRAAAGC